jgi:hypothetical protein
MNQILHRISTGQRISLARFNDGEVGAMVGDFTVTSRGKQDVTDRLKMDLASALHYKSEGYFIGIPCPECYPTYYKVVKQTIKGYQNQILAVSTTNNHYNYFKTELLSLLKDKSVGIVADRRLDLPLNNVTYYTCSGENALNDIDSLMERLEDHDYYILTIGAASRILAHKLHEKGKNALDLGSIFDPEKGKPLKAHIWPSKYQNSQNYCPICNY